ncbi:GNAT family N-acetyltransferase [Primorskyibacter aestuariivivens]|uniref:GNAT family N-acetyltransferase n=1 Tax=Primorskyibacter aestuariivivens TaxID=1888912 RepID=UPI0023002BB2|nr:GNAT family N-acetyltransferase [Primorskyibacter aestuariivivens]MDA7429669.1 GNAT family N-acetyltransferase [Primorskyibacter aestuariivivens]
MILRRLSAADAPAFHALWLDGLGRFPSAFLLTEAEALATPVDAIAKAMDQGGHWGAFERTEMIALGVLRRGGPERLRHTGDIGPLYVHPDLQGRGVGSALLTAMLDAARVDGLLQVELCVDVDNHGARRLYEIAGFTRFGLRPRSVLLDGQARDDLLMMLCFDA